MAAADPPRAVPPVEPAPTAPTAPGVPRWFPLLVVAVVLVLHAPAFAQPVFDNDEAYAATVAAVLSDGGDLYVDVVDRKPPGVFALYRLASALTGTTALWGPRVLAALAHSLTALGVWRLAQRRFGARAGATAGLLAALASATLLPRDAQSANFEVFMLPGIVAAMLLADRRRLGAAGLALGLAALAKQTALTTLLPLAWTAVRSERRVRELGALAAGVAAPIAVAALALGPARYWFWNFGPSSSGYLDPGGDLVLVAGRLVGMTAVVALLNLGLLLLVSAAWRDRRRDLDLWWWLASGVIGAFAGWRFFGHYYWQVLPPLCVLAGRGALRVGRVRVRVAVALMVVAAIGSATAAVLLDRIDPQREYEPIAAWLREHTGPEETVFVWGHLPEVYWDADRRPGTRFVTTGFLTGHTGGRPAGDVGEHRAVPGAWDDLVADFEHAPPDVVVDTSDADVRRSGWYPSRRFPRFAQILERDYREVADLDGVTVHRRRASARPDDAPLAGAARPRG